MFWNLFKTLFFLRNNLQIIFVLKIKDFFYNNIKNIHFNVFFLSKYFFTNSFILVTMYKLNTC